MASLDDETDDLDREDPDDDDDEEQAPTPQAASHKPGPNRDTYRQLFTLEQRKLHEDSVEKLMLNGVSSERRIQDALRKSAGASLTQYRIRKIMQRISSRWQSEDAARRSDWKSGQIRRIHEEIRIARDGVMNIDPVTKQPNGTFKIKPNLAALARFEELLSKIQGTQEPVRMKVDMEITETVLNVIGTMDPDEMRAVLEQEAELERLADIGRRTVAELPDGVTVEEASIVEHPLPALPEAAQDDEQDDDAGKSAAE